MLQAIAAVRCGVPAAAIGRVGSDAFGQQIISTLQAEHVNCDFLTQTDNAHSGLATIIEEAGLDNVFIDFLGANFQLTNEDIDQCLSAVEQAKLVIIHMGPAAMDVATHMIELGRPVSHPPSWSIPRPMPTFQTTCGKRWTIWC